MTKGEVPGTTYGLSDSGWIDMVLFKEYFYIMQGKNYNIIFSCNSKSL